MDKKIGLELPDKLELFHLDTSLEIVRTWFGWRTVLGTAFAVFLDGVFFLFLFFFFGSKDYGIGRPPLLVALYFGTFWGAIATVMTYYAVAGWFNRTRIRVQRGKITVRHGPIPWAGNRELEVSSVKQLYAKEGSRSRDGSSSIYEVHAITHSGLDIKVVSGLDTSGQALYIEREIEKYLGIEDIPVKSEIDSPASSGRRTMLYVLAQVSGVVVVLSWLFVRSCLSGGSRPSARRPGR